MPATDFDGFDHDALRLYATQLEAAQRIASKFLGRWDDPFTVSIRDDLGQQVAMAAVEKLRDLRDLRSFPAFVRTIARRKRALAIRDDFLRRVLPLEGTIEGDGSIADELARREPATQWYQVAGEWIPECDMLRVLPDILVRIPRLNGRLLHDYYEGFSCGELAERYGLSIENVKVRIHRSRRRIKELFELRVIRHSGELR